MLLHSTLAIQACKSWASDGLQPAPTVADFKVLLALGRMCSQDQEKHRFMYRTLAPWPRLGVVEPFSQLHTFGCST